MRPGAGLHIWSYMYTYVCIYIYMIYVHRIGSSVSPAVNRSFTSIQMAHTHAHMREVPVSVNVVSTKISSYVGRVQVKISDSCPYTCGHICAQLCLSVCQRMSMHRSTSVRGVRQWICLSQYLSVNTPACMSTFMLVIAGQYVSICCSVCHILSEIKLHVYVQVGRHPYIRILHSIALRCSNININMNMNMSIP